MVKFFDDRSFEAGEPAELTVSDMVDGFATALQNMHPGDRWEIWIPQQMGYGSAGRSASGSVIIKPYTTLIFDLESYKDCQRVGSFIKNNYGRLFLGVAVFL